MQSRHSRTEHRESLVSHKSYQLWASMVANLAKTPRGLERPRAEYSDLELCGYVLQENREDIIRLWEAFTTDRAEISRYLMEPKREALVYLLGFHLANQARLSGVLDRAEYRHRLLSTVSRAEKIHLVDIGCGSGALSHQTAQELWSYRSELPISFELVDRSQAFIDMAQKGLALLKADSDVVTRKQKLDDYLSRELREAASGELVWYQLGYVWNEVKQSPKTSQLLLRYLEQGLEAGPRILTVLEPANQEIARDAMELRDTLTAMGYIALYPCPHSQACPMLERTRDWCYSEFVWDRPPLVKKVDKILKIDRQRIGVAAYVFVSPDVYQELEKARHEAVVVGRPVDRQTKNPLHSTKSYLLCQPEPGLTKQKAEKEDIELLRGQFYRAVKKSAKDKADKTDPGEKRIPRQQKPRNPKKRAKE